MFASIACTDIPHFQRQPRPDDWPATRSSARETHEQAGEFRVCELAPQCMAKPLLVACRSDMILAVTVLLIVTDSEACASTQANFPFRCNDLKLFDASSVLAMDEKQSLALSKCRLKRKMYRDSVLILEGDRMVANESLTIELFDTHGSFDCQPAAFYIFLLTLWTIPAFSRGQKWGGFVQTYLSAIVYPA